MAFSRALVTGGSGFVGSAIVRALLESEPDCHITVLDRQIPTEYERASRVSYVGADVESPSQLQDAFQQAKPQIIIHTAGFVPPLNERYARRLEAKVKSINVEGTRNVLKAASEAGSEVFIYTSSCCAVTDDFSMSYANIDERWPSAARSSIYGESKAEAESVVLGANCGQMSTCVLRPAVVFGEGDYQLLPSIHACIAKGETSYQLGDGTNLWDTVYVGNVADAHVLAVQNLLSSKCAAGEVFFIQNNQPISFREFSLAVWKEFGHYPPFQIKIPAGLGWVLGCVAECFTWVSGTPTTLSRGSVLDACAMRYASGQKARRLLGYEPRVGLEEGIERSCRVSLPHEPVHP